MGNKMGHIDIFKGHLTKLYLAQLSLLLSLMCPFTSLAFQCELEQMAAPLYQAQKQIHQYQLKNGIKVSFLAKPKRQTVSLVSHFNIGSAHEKKGQTGYAHLFEHLLFKGSKHAPNDTYSRQLKALGANFNASTHFDYTNYYARFPSAATKLALFLDADRFIHPVLTQETVNNQQAAVLEEMATRIDNQPYIRKAMNFLLKQVEGTPYGHAVIGNKADIKQASPASLSQFHRQHYQPNQLHLALVGNIPHQAPSWIDEYFGDWQPTKGLANKGNTQLEPLIDFNIQGNKHQAQIVDDRGPWPGLLLAWHTVPQSHTDAAAISLLENYIFQNKTSLIQKASLKDPAMLLSYSMPFPMARHGMSNLVLVPRARTSLDELAEGVEALLQQAANSELSSTKLCQLKQNWLTQQLSLLNRDLALAQYIAARPHISNALTFQWQQINRVSQQDIKRVAKRYFQDKMIRLDLLPPWYIRWVKAITETLPKAWSDAIERSLL